MKYKIFFLLLLNIIPFLSFSKQIEIKEKINWKPIKSIHISENETQTLLTFENAIFKSYSGNLPVYFKKIELSSKGDIIHAEFKNTVYKPLNNLETNHIIESGKIEKSIIIHITHSAVKKVPYANISFIPIRLNSETGKYEKLIFFELEINIIEAEKDVYKTVNYRNNSVLSNGDWYKIRVNQTGINKITYDDLLNMGINVSSINPKNLRIYGNGGGMLPESNLISTYDDLQENAIIVIGEDDGSFDKNDYILFYGESPNTWEYRVLNQYYIHTLNNYSYYTYYFITTDLGEGKRIISQQSSGLTPTNFITVFDDYAYHEIEMENLINTGRTWYGETFDIVTSYEFPFSFPNLDKSKNVNFRITVAARSDNTSYFKVYANSQSINEFSVPKIYNGSNSSYAKSVEKYFSFPVNNDNINIKLDYRKTASNSIGWLNYFEINVCRHLKFSGSQMSFRNASSTGIGNISKFTLSNANNSVNIWNITDPHNIMYVDATLSGNDLTFTLPTDSLLEFTAHNGTSYLSPEYVEKVPNQNLHALNNIDMIIVSHPGFIDQAYRLAEHHINYDNLSVFLVKPQEIYNEFSSGAQDISAIRNFVKMLYDKANTGEEPKYLLLFGDASFDYKNILPDNTNFVPTWESVESLNLTTSYATDDYFGLLDDNEGTSANGDLDIGIGRFPVFTTDQAKASVDKTLNYIINTEPVMGNWRNIICFIADDEDGDLHLEQAEEMAAIINANFKNINVDKIYLDAYPQISTPGGQRYPEVKEAINRRVEKGALVINYTGHGGEVGWSHERILELSDIYSWENYNKLPVFVTATCEFSRYDDPERTSAGEYIFLNPDGGSVLMLTTSRATYASFNIKINKCFYTIGFKKINGEYPRMGDIIMLSKIESGSTTNDRKYILLGDPAMRMAYPEDSIATVSINGQEINIVPDTIKALSKVTISGSIFSDDGEKLTNYDGIITPTVFDKPSKITTFGHDQGSTPKTFYIQNNILYKGKAQITNGDFSFTFVVPKDIGYNYGFGKISYYAQDKNSDASGYYENIIVGGYDNNVKPDYTGPVIDLYMNDENFVFGGITNENPDLLAFVNDESGINTVGNGIGHDIVTILDDNTENLYVLNDYYEADINSYTSGTIRYPFSNLSEGMHNLSLKVWDVFNNSSTAYIEFFVTVSSEMAIEHLYNYPNPFISGTGTSFVFEHNQANTNLEVQIQIFALNGQLVKTINTFVYTNGFRSDPIKWYGTNDNGSNVKKGMYIYRLLVKNPDGSFNEKRSKLVLMK